MYSVPGIGQSLEKLFFVHQSVTFKPSTHNCRISALSRSLGTKGGVGEVYPAIVLITGMKAQVQQSPLSVCKYRRQSLDHTDEYPVPETKQVSAPFPYQHIAFRQPDHPPGHLQSGNNSVNSE